MANVKVTDFAGVAVRKKHCDINMPPLGWTPGLVSFTGSPWTASISALVSSAQTSIFGLAGAEPVPAFVFCGKPLSPRPAGNGIAEKSRAQDKTRIAKVWVMCFLLKRRRSIGLG